MAKVRSKTNWVWLQLDTEFYTNMVDHMVETGLWTTIGVEPTMYFMGGEL